MWSKHTLRNTTTNVNVKTDYFGSLEKPILKSKGKGDIFIMGELNDRTGNKENIRNSKLNEHLNDILPSSGEASKLTKRCSNDLKTNTSGNTSIELTTLELHMSKQTPGDRIGNFTCFNNNGASVVDNVLAESPI